MNNLECFLGDINLHYKNSGYNKITAENTLNNEKLFGKRDRRIVRGYENSLSKNY